MLRTKIIGLLLLLALSGCSSPPRPAAPLSALRPSPTQRGSWSGAVQQRLLWLSEDFAAVVAGRRPIHAHFDETALLPADGGTTFYVGDGYRMTVQKSSCRVGDVDGYLYGPIITLQPDLGGGNSDTISHVTFYTTDEFKRLSN